MWTQYSKSLEHEHCVVLALICLHLLVAYKTTDWGSICRRCVDSTAVSALTYVPKQIANMWYRSATKCIIDDSTNHTTGLPPQTYWHFPDFLCSSVSSARCVRQNESLRYCHDVRPSHLSVWEGRALWSYGEL